MVKSVISHKKSGRTDFKVGDLVEYRERPSCIMLITNIREPLLGDSNSQLLDGTIVYVYDSTNFYTVGTTDTGWVAQHFNLFEGSITLSNGHEEV